jgi:hypothetical protein
MKIIDFKLEQLSRQYDSDDPDIVELKLVVKTIIEEKTFRFTHTDATQRFPLSVTKGRLIQDGRIVARTDMTLSEDTICLYALMRGLNQAEPYDFSKPLMDLVAFIDKAWELLDRNGAVMGGWMLERLQRFLFVATFRAGHYDPMSQMRTIPVSHHAHPLLYRLYFTNPGIWNYAFDKFWATAAEYVTATGGEKPGVMDLNWHEAMKTVVAELEKQQDLASTKTVVLASMGDNPVGRMAEIALCWLDSQAAFPDDDILSWLDDPPKVTSAIVVVTNRKAVVSQLAERFWERVMDFALTDAQRLLFYQFVVKVLDKSVGLQQKSAEQMKGYLLSEVEKAEENQVWALLYAMQSYTTGKDFVTRVIDQVIALIPNKEIYNRAIGNYYIAINELEPFFTFVHRFAMWPERYFKIKHFGHSCNHFYQTNPVAYLWQVVKLPMLRSMRKNLGVLCVILLTILLITQRFNGYKIWFQKNQAR